MREFIGHKLKLVVEGFPGPVEGVLIDDTPQLILVKGANGGVTRIPKGKICGFTPVDFEPKDYVPMHVLYCEHKEGGCPGVQFIKEGDSVARADFEPFMSACSCRDVKCSYGTKGELRSVSGSVLKKMLVGTMYGDYPTRKAVQNGDTNKTGGTGKKG